MTKSELQSVPLRYEPLYAARNSTLHEHKKFENSNYLRSDKNKYGQW